MRLVFFDIDGTLITAGGIGRRSTRAALETVFGTSGNLDEFYPGGRTQEAIFVDTLTDAGIENCSYLKKRDQLYLVFLENFKNNLDQGDYRIEELPGATELISYLVGSNNYALGLVTGNHEVIARLKLQYSGIDPADFLAGAYGQESADRSKLVPLAKERAEAVTGIEFPDYFTIVIGDTTRDVLSAQSVGATCFALTTGTDDREKLLAVNPDSIFDNLNDVLKRFKFLEGKTGGIDGI